MQAPSRPELPSPEPKNTDFAETVACDDPGEFFFSFIWRRQAKQLHLSSILYIGPCSSHEGVHLWRSFTTSTSNCLSGTFPYIPYLPFNRAYSFTHERNLRKEHFRCTATQLLWVPIIVPRFSPALHTLYPFQWCSLSLKSLAQGSFDDAQKLHQYCW